MRQETLVNPYLQEMNENGDQRRENEGLEEEFALRFVATALLGSK